MNHRSLRYRFIIVGLLAPVLLVLALVGACKGPNPHPRPHPTGPKY